MTLSITQSLYSFRYWRRFGVWARTAAASAVMVDWVFSSLKLHAPHIISWINETFPLGARMFYQPLLSLVIGLLVAVIWLKCRRGMSDQEVADNLAQHIRKESNHTLEGSAAWLAISIPDVLIPVIARYSDAIADIFSAYLAESLGPVLKLCFGVLAAKAIEYCRQGRERPQSPVVDENPFGCSSSA